MSKILIKSITIIVVSVHMVFASELSQLISKLEKKGIITKAEAQELKMKDMLHKKTLSNWMENISFMGDLRLRHQVDWDASKDYVRNRERIRFRFGAVTKLAEDFTVNFRIATGSEKIADDTISDTSLTNDEIIDKEAASTNHTLGSAFGKARLMLDYAYLGYYPVSWCKILGGKVKAKNHVWNTTDLLWDGDINPDGLIVKFNRTLSPKVKLNINTAWLLFNETKSSDADPDAYIFQPVIDIKVDNDISCKAAIAVQNLNVNGKDCETFGTPAFDYITTNPSFEIKHKNFIRSYTLKLFGDMIVNGDSAASSDASGSAFGFQFGTLKINEAGKWNVKYISRKLEANSWLNKLGDSDHYGGETNSAGFEIIAAVGLTGSLTLGIDYYVMDKINGSTPNTSKNLLQTDVVYKF